MVAAEHLDISYEDYPSKFSGENFFGGEFLNYGLIVIFDEDSDYADCLADYFRTKGCLASEIVVFTKKDPFLDFIEKNSVDILIINQELKELINGISSDNIFLLCETKVSVPDTANTHFLYKYSSAEELLRQVMADYNPSGTGACISFTGRGDGKIIGICSPLGRCGKTSFSLSLGLRLSLNNTCLFISFDECSSIHLFPERRRPQEKNLTDLLYYFLQSPELMESRLLSTIKSVQNLDCISPSVQPGIYTEVTPDDWISFLSCLKALRRYDYIVLDFGTLQPVSHMLKLCNHIFIPELKNDSYSETKLSLFLESLNSAHGSNASGKPDGGNNLPIHRIFVPFVNFSPNGTDYLVSLTSGELGQFTALIISDYDL